MPATEFQWCFDRWEFDAVDFPWVDQILNVDYQECYTKRLIERIRTDEIDPCGDTFGVYEFFCGTEEPSSPLRALHDTTRKNPKLSLPESLHRAETLPASPSLSEAVESIGLSENAAPGCNRPLHNHIAAASPENAALRSGHPLHYHIATGSRNVKYRIRELLCETLRSAGQVPSGKCIFSTQCRKA